MALTASGVANILAARSGAPWDANPALGVPSVKITDVTTTELNYPDAQPTQDSTVPAPTSGRGQLFIHLHTDEGFEGLGICQSSPGVRQVVESGLKGVLIARTRSA